MRPAGSDMPRSAPSTSCSDCSGESSGLGPRVLRDFGADPNRLRGRIHDLLLTDRGGRVAAGPPSGAPCAQGADPPSVRGPVASGRISSSSVGRSPGGGVSGASGRSGAEALMRSTAIERT